MHRALVVESSLQILVRRLLEHLSVLEFLDELKLFLFEPGNFSLNLKSPLVLVHNLLLQPLSLAESLFHLLLLLTLKSFVVLVLYDLLHLRVFELLLVFLLLDYIESFPFLTFQSISFIFGFQMGLLPFLIELTLNMLPQFLVFLCLELSFPSFLILSISLLFFLFIVPNFDLLDISCFLLGILDFLPSFLLLSFEKRDPVGKQLDILSSSFPSDPGVDKFLTNSAI